MIRRGRTRRGGPPGLDWHEVLGSRRRRSVAATRASWAALAGAGAGLILVLLGASPWWQLGLSVVAATAAAVWPVPDARAWAQRWIASQQGLSYATALEAPQDEDPYGLWSASRDRALLDLRDARPPASSSWWLPPLVGAALLLALPHLAPLRSGSPFGPVSPSVAGRNTGEEGARGTMDAAEADEARDEGSEGEPGPPDGPEAPPPATEDEEAPAEAGEETAPEDEAGGDAGAEGAEGEGTGEEAAEGREAVDRYLRELEDRRDSETRNPFDPVPESPQPRGGAESRPGGDELQDGGARAEPSEAGASEARDESAPGARPSPERRPDESTGGAGADPAEEAADEPGDAPDEASPGAEEGAEEGAEDAGGAAEEEEAPGADAGEEAGGGAGEADAAPPEPGDGGEGAGESGDVVDEGATPGEDASDGSAGTPAQAAERGAREEPSEDGGDGAGGDPGVEAPAEPLPGRAGGGPTDLGGETLEGETPVVGSTRGGGSAPEAVPEGARAPAGYVRDAERSTEESGVPSAYREIIRRYFR